jgi:hypothetical protein
MIEFIPKKLGLITSEVELSYRSTKKAIKKSKGLMSKRKQLNKSKGLISKRNNPAEKRLY